jgi:ribosomal protein S18 acetylase RimI-like enzyme
MEYAFLTMLLISKDFQGRGIGKLLLEFSIKDLTKRGFKNYGLEVLKSNENAKRLYERLGFITKETRGELWYMEKTLK